MIDFIGRYRPQYLATPQFGKSENEGSQGFFTPCASTFQPRTRRESAHFSLAPLPRLRLRGRSTAFSHSAIFPRSSLATHRGRTAPTGGRSVRVMFGTP